MNSIPGMKLIVKKLKSSMRKISVERDKLRDLMSEVENIEGVSTEAVNDLESVIDNLSQYM